MKAEWIDNNRRIECIYWHEYVSCEDVESESEEYDEVQFCYPKNGSEHLAEIYPIELIEGEEHIYGGRIYSKSIDLTQSDDAIFSGFSKTRRYKTRRACERDHLDVEFYYRNIEGNILTDFIQFYNEFANQKKLCFLNESKIKAFVESKQFAIAIVKDEQGKNLVMNSYIFSEDDKIVSLYTSASLFRNNETDKALIGRANGFLHFQAMRFFKESGYTKYDLGGFYMGSSDKDKINISAYKSSLGGILDEYMTGFIIRFDHIRNMLDNIVSLKNFIINKGVIIYGAAVWGKYIIKKLNEIYGIDPVCIIDNRLSYSNSKFKYKEYLENFDPKNTIIIVTTMRENYERICEDIYTKPWVEKKSVFCIREKILAL